MNKKKIAINILSIIGLILSLELCKVFINANFIENAAPSICAINEAYDCDKVAQSQFSQFLGVPLALWGVILYLFFLVMNNVEKLQTKRFLGFLQVFKNPNSYMYCIGLVAFIISIFLALISKFAINSICIFCLITYFINLAIALIAKQWGAGIFYELKNSIKDFIAAIKQPKYAIAFVLVMTMACGCLYILETTKILAPNALHISKKAKKITIKEATGNLLGTEDATLVIHEYMDFNCGGCFYANLYLHRIASEFENVKVIQHNLPLDKECNYKMKFDGHKGSCLKTRYALAAAKQNKYWQMSNLLFFIQGIENEDDIIEFVKNKKFDIKKLKADANSEEIKNQITEGIREADRNEVKVTPTIFVGVKKVEGLPSYPEFKQIVIEQGGIERK